MKSSTPRRLPPSLLAMTVAVLTCAARAQDPCAGLVRAWVDPVLGQDPVYSLPLAAPAPPPLKVLSWC